MKKISFIIIFLFHIIYANAQEFHEKVIITGQTSSYPYEFLDENGEAAGFSIDIIKEIMDRMEQEYSIELSDWETASTRLLNGEAKCISSMVYNHKRAKDFRFGQTIAWISHFAVHKKT